MADFIEVKCMGCGKSMKLKPEMAGKKGKCPICGKIINIPDPSVKMDLLSVNKDVSDDTLRNVAKQIAAGTGPRQKKKKGFFARMFGRK